MRFGRDSANVPDVELGARYRDEVTGFTGVATSKTEFLYGCVRVALTTLSAGGEVKCEAFDAPQLKRVEEAKAVDPPAAARRTGGDRPMPSASR